MHNVAIIALRAGVSVSFSPLDVPAVSVRSVSTILKKSTACDVAEERTVYIKLAWEML